MRVQGRDASRPAPSTTLFNLTLAALTDCLDKAVAANAQGRKAGTAPSAMRFDGAWWKAGCALFHPTLS